MDVLQPRAYLSRFLSQGVRPDGRLTHAARRVTLALGTIGKADGSATVRLGSGTSVVAAVTVQIVPLAGAAAAALATDTPGANASINVEVTLPPMASQRFRSRGGGPASAIELRKGPSIARDVERILAGCSVVDTSQLLVEEGVCGLKLVVDIVVTAADGNFEDAAVIAAVAALATTTLPAAEKRLDVWSLVRPGDEAESKSKPSRTVPASKLRVSSLLVPTTFVLIELDKGASTSGSGEPSGGEAAAGSSVPAASVLVADPLDAEEVLASARARVVIAAPLAVSASADGGWSTGPLSLAGLSSSGTALSEAQLAACGALAQQRAEAVAQVIRAAVAASLG